MHGVLAHFYEQDEFVQDIQPFKTETLSNAFVLDLLSVVVNVDFTPAGSFTNEEFEKEILLFKTETVSNAFALDSFSVEHKKFVKDDALQ